MLIICLSLSAQALRPVPHEMTIDGKKTLDWSKGFALTDSKSAFSGSIDFLPINPKGVNLVVDFGKDIAAQVGVMAQSGAYGIKIDSKGVAVTGYDEKGAFHGLQTLSLLIASSEDMRLPCCQINDWPDSPKRGIVDSYHGGNWTQDFRLSIIELAARLKMNEYVYAPKNDPYVGSPEWYMPYQQGREENLKELIEACRRNRIDFIWCVRPDSAFSWSEADYGLLLGKFEMMHYLGVRSFGIFLDDVPDTENLEIKKAELIERLNADFIAKKQGLEPLLTSLEGYWVPAEGSESVKLGMYATADRSWNKDAYDPAECLKWATGEIAPDVADAYATYARHSDVALNAFGLEESSELELAGLNSADKNLYDKMMCEFKSIEAASHAMSSTSNKALYEDLRQYLDEFAKLGTRCRRIIECVEYYNTGDIPGFWSTYAENLMSDEDMNAYLEHPSGTARLQPYYERMMKELAEAFDAAYKGKVAYTYLDGEGIDTYIAPDEASFCHLILDNPEGHEVILRLSDAKGRYTAEFCIDTSYFEFEMKEDAIKVEVIGDVDVFEAVFVK